jgi:hypothetical protein
MAKVKTVKNERDPPLFTSKQLIKFLKDSKKHNSSEDRGIPSETARMPTTRSGFFSCPVP